MVHFYRNVFSLASSGKVRDIAKMLKAIHAQESRLRHIAGTQLSTRTYMKMTPLFADQTQGAVVA